MAKYNIYISGVCTSKTSGGFGCVATKEGKMVGEENGGTDKDATGNRMALWAVLTSLRMFPDKSEITICTDEEYAVKASLNINKRACNLDILNLIDIERARMKKVDYRWLKDCEENEKKPQEYCTSLALKAINNKNFINIANYFPEKCVQPDSVEEEKEEQERRNKINELIDNIQKELFELKKII